ncbi:hypothetical protein GDO78_021107 [Eleutherodactylus coqui]|uniref:Uncharacterized protein n=2 Tax=Eleutherodactylus coqui TaxID=57060 RepID=A0A8J6EH92_ELECQ|nr:hypothetical protein GDO78_021107 [Eleutherodactylus coqui]
MELHGSPIFLLSLLLGQGFVASFNIDAKRPQVLRGPEDAQFGYKVLQHEADGEKW